MASDLSPAIFRFWHAPTAPPPFAGILAAAIDGYSPGWRVDLTAGTLPAAFLEVVGDSTADEVADDHQQVASHLANLLRWWLLYEVGGVWLDHDVVPLADLTQLPRPWCAALGAEFVSCAVGMDRGDPLALSMLQVGLAAKPSDRPAAEVSGDAILNGWVRPHAPGQYPIHQLARASLNPVPLPFDAQGQPVVPAGTPPVGGRTVFQLVHLWNHRNPKE